MFKLVAISAKRKPVSVRVGWYTELAEDRAQRLGVSSEELPIIDDIKRMLSLGRRINAGGKEAAELYRLTQTHGTSIYLGVLATRLYQAEYKTYPTLEAALTTLKATRDTLMQATREDFHTLFENFIAPYRIVEAIWKTLGLEEGASVSIEGVVKGLKERESELAGHLDPWVTARVVIQAVEYWVARMEGVAKPLAESVYKRQMVSKADVDKLLECQDIFQTKARRDQVLDVIWGVFLQQSTTNVLIPMSKIEAQWKAAIPLLDSYLQHYYAFELEKSSVALTKWVHSENLDRHRLDLYSARVSAEKAVPYRENESQTLLNEFRKVFRKRLSSFKVPEQYAPQIEWELARLRPRTKASDVLSFDDSMISQAFFNIVLNEVLATSTLTPLYQGLSKERMERSSLPLSQFGAERLITPALVKRQLDTFVNSISYIPTFQKQGIRDEELGKVINLKRLSPYKSDQSIITDIICSRRSDMKPFWEVAVAHSGGVTQELFERFEAYSPFKLNTIELSTVIFLLHQESKSPSEVVDDLRQKQQNYRDALAERDLFHKHGLVGEQATFAQILAKAVSKLPFLNPKPIVTALVEWVKQTYEQDKKMRWESWEAFGVQSEDLPILEEKMQAKPSNSGYSTHYISQGDSYSVVSKPLYDLFFEKHNIPGRSALSALFNGVSQQYKASFDLGYGALLSAILNPVSKECERVLRDDASYGPWGGRWFFEKTNPLLIYGEDPKSAYKNLLKTSSSSQMMAFQSVYFEHAHDCNQALANCVKTLPKSIQDDFIHRKITLRSKHASHPNLHTSSRLEALWNIYSAEYNAKRDQLEAGLIQVRRTELIKYLKDQGVPLSNLETEAKKWAQSVRSDILESLGASGSKKGTSYTGEIGELNSTLPYPSLDREQLNRELNSLRGKKAAEAQRLRDAEQARLRAEIDKFLTPLSTPHQNQLRPLITYLPITEIKAKAESWANGVREGILRELGCTNASDIAVLNIMLPYPSLDREGLRGALQERNEARRLREVEENRVKAEEERMREIRRLDEIREENRYGYYGRITIVNPDGSRVSIPAREYSGQLLDAEEKESYSRGKFTLPCMPNFIDENDRSSYEYYMRNGGYVGIVDPDGGMYSMPVLQYSGQYLDSGAREAYNKGELILPCPPPPLRW